MLRIRSSWVCSAERKVVRLTELLCGWGHNVELLHFLRSPQSSKALRCIQAHYLCGSKRQSGSLLSCRGSYCVLFSFPTLLQNVARGLRQATEEDYSLPDEQHLDHCIIIDRSVDLVTPLVTPLTLEAVLAELTRTQNGECSQRNSKGGRRTVCSITGQIKVVCTDFGSGG